MSAISSDECLGTHGGGCALVIASMLLKYNKSNYSKHTTNRSDPKRGKGGGNPPDDFGIPYLLCSLFLSRVSRRHRAFVTL